MKRAVRTISIALGILLLLLLVVPLLIPVPALEGTQPVQALAGPDGRFIRIKGVEVHYVMAGQGEPSLILMHGFAASTFSWREVLAPLAEGHRVVAFDRPGFGLTVRPLEWERQDWEGGSPYGARAAVQITIELMDALEIEQAVLVGNSAGGALAVQIAQEYPERVQGLVLVDPAVYTGGGTPAWIRPFLGLPQMDRLGPLFVRRIRDWGLDFARSAWHDPSRITPEMWAGFLKPLQADHWDRGLWEVVRAGQETEVTGQLRELSMPILVISGDDDRIVPTEESIRLAGELPGAELVVIPQCGHTPQEECPGAFLQAVHTFMESLRTRELNQTD